MSEALNGVAVFAPDGTMIGRIALPERCANLCFGGLKRNRLFMAASQSLYAVYVNTEGAIGDTSRGPPGYGLDAKQPIVLLPRHARESGHPGPPTGALP